MKRNEYLRKLALEQAKLRITQLLMKNCLLIRCLSFKHPYVRGGTSTKKIRPIAA
jgi:hypothetical protein